MSDFRRLEKWRPHKIVYDPDSVDDKYIAPWKTFDQIQEDRCIAVAVADYAIRVMMDESKSLWDYQ